MNKIDKDEKVLYPNIDLYKLDTSLINRYN